MAGNDTLLVLAAGPLSAEAVSRVEEQRGRSEVHVLSLGPTSEEHALPPHWRRRNSAEWLDTNQLREQFLAFLNDWPQKRFPDGKCFDEMFRQAGGYSVWWTGPGMSRHPDKEPFLALRDLWIAGRAIDALAPKKIWMGGAESDVAGLLASRCRRQGRPYEFLPGSARPVSSPWRGAGLWLVKAVARLAIAPWTMLARAVAARLLTCGMGASSPENGSPAAVMTAGFPLDVWRWPDDPPVWLWRQAAQALKRASPDLRLRYLLHTTGVPINNRRLVGRLFHSGWPLLRGVEGVLPLRERYVCWGAFFRAAPRQILHIFRYFRLERSPAFRSSFEFAGADVACLYVPSLRRAVGGTAAWNCGVAATEKALRSAGDVAVMLVHEEFYGVGSVDIAAARRRGIPTVGVQHGTVFPMHLIYTLPPGQAAGAPIPDYFAAYGEYAKEVLSRCGAYPADRVWITGGPRFDPLVNRPPDAVAARRRLGLPLEARIVLLATQKYPWFQQAARAVFQVARERSDVLVCLKTHPLDVPLETYRAIAGRVGAANVRFFADRFDDLLAACDVLISGSSTTVLEASLLGRKTICANFSDEPDRFPYVADGAALPGRCAAQLADSLERLFRADAEAEIEANRGRFLERHLGPTAFGKGGDSLAAHVLNLIRNRSPGQSKVEASHG